tara:strand:+ start:1046 stop:1258 length:213 start_codon:yes stop_codon:yes gene_type:complete
MKFDKEMVMKIALVIFGMIAGIAGYEVVQDDDEVTISLPEQAEEAPAAEEPEKAPEAEEAPAEPAAPSEE